MSKEKEQPLILVVYMDRQLMYDHESIGIISESMKEVLDNKGVNAITYFVPTDGQEKIECINPVIATDEQIERIDKMIKDIEKSFDIGHDLTQDLEGSAIKPFKGDD